ncbi:MAG TPA: pectate lyase [Gammaproteobacteria bacterium]|nr:pectate lyase [Gammaproteobacteria bacterium]
MNMLGSASIAAMLLAALLSLPGCTSGNGDPEDPEVGDNRTACEALAPPGRSGGSKGLLGFAAVEADGRARTTGGAGGSLYSARSYGELAGLLDNGHNDAPKIIEISGILTGTETLMVGSNTTLIGVGDEPAIHGFGFKLSGKQNVIIADLDFSGGPDNALGITDGSHHVWVHHNAFSAYKDDTVEIREGASYVTIAWNHFHNQNRVLLAGHSDDNGGQDTGRLKITLHHNWFDGTTQRQPLVRFGEAHVFNNFYDNVDFYGAASSMEADMLVQANYFKNVKLPTSRGPVATGTLDEGDVVECANVYADSGDPETRGAAFDPADFYSYPLDDAADVPRIVMAGAGPDPAAPSDDDPVVLDPQPAPDEPAPPPVDEPPPPEQPPPMNEPPPEEHHPPPPPPEDRPPPPPPPEDPPHPPPEDRPPPPQPPSEDPPHDGGPGMGADDGSGGGPG